MILEGLESAVARASDRVTRLVAVVHRWVRVLVGLTLRPTVSGLARTLSMVTCMRLPGEVELGCDRSSKIDYLLLVSYGGYGCYTGWWTSRPQMVGQVTLDAPDQGLPTLSAH